MNLHLHEFFPWFTLEALVVGVGIFLLMVEAFCKFPKRDIGWAAVFGLLLIFAASFFCGDWGIDNPSFYLVDSLSIFFKRFLLLATIFTIVMAMEYAPVYKRFIPSATPEAGLGELFILPIFACAGLMWMASAANFVMIFVSLELVTISFYILVASMRKNNASLEAGVKYLILGALSTGFLVYGIAWLAGNLFGLTSLPDIDALFLNAPGKIPAEAITPILFGLGLVIVGLGFKVAAFPFQFWVPDVYQGAPTPVTAFLSIGSKAAGFVVLIRVVYPFLHLEATAAKTVGLLTILAALTLLYGNLAAIPQNNLKRLLAYSSVAHAGYLLVGVASLSSLGSVTFAIPAISYYLAGYLIMTFLAFVVLQHITVAGGTDEISDFNGLAYRSPILAGGMLVSMLSLAGLPFTVGFLGKFFIFEAAYAAHQYWLMAFGTITVACGFYYYLKVVRVMFWQSAPTGAPALVVSNLSRFVILLLGIAIFFFGIYPAPLLALFR